MRTLVLEAGEGGELAVAIATQKTDAIVRIHQINRCGADVKDAEHHCLDAELPFTAEKGFVPINRKRFAETGRKDFAEIQALRILSITCAEVGPTGIGMEGGKEHPARKPLRMRFRDGHLDPLRH